jgi:hypothetical protein
MDDSDLAQVLPPPGPPFTVGETVAFFPAEIGPTSNWLRLDYAVIEALDERAESFTFHFVGQPNEHGAQGSENIVRRSDHYFAWRSLWQEVFARTGDETVADRETRQLWLRVLAEHPLHGSRMDRHPALPPSPG